MPDTLSPAVRKLLTKPNFASLATLFADGRPQVTPVWIDVADGVILVNTAHDRVKERNMRRDPRVALSIFDMENPYTWAVIQGTVVEVTTEGAEKHIDKLSRRYLGEDYPMHGDRVIFKIRPDRVAASV